jgi:peptidoglycan hydrolase CwlO-like protein
LQLKHEIVELQSRQVFLDSDASYQLVMDLQQQFSSLAESHAKCQEELSTLGLVVDGIKDVQAQSRISATLLAQQLKEKEDKIAALQDELRKRTAQFNMQAQNHSVQSGGLRRVYFP